VPPVVLNIAQPPAVTITAARTITAKRLRLLVCLLFIKNSLLRRVSGEVYRRTFGSRFRNAETKLLKRVTVTF